HSRRRCQRVDHRAQHVPEAARKGAGDVEQNHRHLQERRLIAGMGPEAGGAGCRIYLITPPVLEPMSFAESLAAALDAGDVAAVQLRLKDVDDDTWRRAIDALLPVTQSRGVAFLLNDRADLVRETGSDGAHVGQEDMPAREARRVMGPDAILGVTCKGSRDLAMQAGEGG